MSERHKTSELGVEFSELKFGKLLERYREARGWSQSELARRTGCSPSSVARYESWSRFPKRSRVSELAKALELDERETDALLDSAGYLDLRAIIVDPTYHEELWKVAKIVLSEATSEEDKANFNERLRAMATEYYGREAVRSTVSLSPREDGT